MCLPSPFSSCARALQARGTPPTRGGTRHTKRGALAVTGTAGRGSDSLSGVGAAQHSPLAGVGPDAERGVRQRDGEGHAGGGVVPALPQDRRGSQAFHRLSVSARPPSWPPPCTATWPLPFAFGMRAPSPPRAATACQHSAPRPLTGHSASSLARESPRGTNAIAAKRRSDSGERQSLSPARGGLTLIRLLYLRACHVAPAALQTRRRPTACR